MAGFEYWELVALAAIFFVAGTVKGGIGLGLPTISVALMGTWLPVEQAAAMILIPVIVTNIWQSFVGSALKLILIRIWSLMVALIVGTLLAAELIAKADTQIASGLLGAMLILYAGLGLSGLRFHVPVRLEPVLGPVVGLATGLITGATAIFVIPSVPYLQSLDFRKGRPGREDDPTDPTRAGDDRQAIDALIQSLGLTAMVATLGLALGLGMKGSLSPEVILPGSGATLAAIAGMAVGTAIRNRLSIEVFRRWVLVALLALGTLMVVRAVT